MTEKGRQAFHFGDVHDMFGAQSRPSRAPRRWPEAADAKALGALGLDDNADAAAVRRTYKTLVRRYHPDSNGGDRAQEGKLQAIVAAYTHLRAQPRFKSES